MAPAYHLYRFNVERQFITKVTRFCLPGATPEAQAADDAGASKTKTVSNGRDDVSNLSIDIDLRAFPKGEFNVRQRPGSRKRIN
jgi:hypothetical protein